MRWIYSAVFYLVLPLVLARLALRGIKTPDYLKRIRERLGFYKNQHDHADIWFHAVSVGEAEAIFPLVRRIQSHYPAKKILVTTTTLTGSSRVRAVLGDSVEHVYLPYDLPDAVGRFLAGFRPGLAVVVETEIWPNLFAQCARLHIPLFIVNARLSQKSTRGYLKIPGLMGATLAHVSLIAAQTQADAERFVQIGVKRSRVKAVGNLKFDSVFEPELVEQGKRLKTGLFAKRFVWIIASTHNKEESVFLELYRDLKTAIPNLLLLLAPRHPERFNDVEKLCLQARLAVLKRSSDHPCSEKTDVFLLDSMGELKLFYAAADLAFVGGSLVPAGGHNVLEPAALGVPILFGPYMDNFREIERNILAHQAAIQCPDKAAISEAVRSLNADANKSRELSVRGRQFVEQNRGALARVVRLLSEALAAETVGLIKITHPSHQD
ncbi:MAG: 3-deoxy-D-manno-octulosonic acid transferase [Gammaproteobacteria bacterium HGW-Gammaproteobacteria-3]|nr:MAG: 3-deoxy-D-manno-octulosonic acid transferase [Gammaproteobacteria bacterium HGW-Gammaproteobacteria-3]